MGKREEHNGRPSGTGRAYEALADFASAPDYESARRKANRAAGLDRGRAREGFRRWIKESRE